VGNTTLAYWIKAGASTAKVDGSDKTSRPKTDARATGGRWAKWPTPCRGL